MEAQTRTLLLIGTLPTLPGAPSSRALSLDSGLSSLRGWSDEQNDGMIAGLERKVGEGVVPWIPADGVAGMIPCQASWWSCRCCCC